MAPVFYRPAMLFKHLFAAGKQNTLIFPEIGWTVTIPKKFWLLAEKKLDTMSQKTSAALEILMGKTFGNPVYKQLFAAREMQGFISAGITSLAHVSQHEWEYGNQKVYNSVYNSLREAYKDYQRVNIQTEQERRQKDNIIFDRYEIKVATPTSTISTTRFYAGAVNNYGLLITTCFEEEKTGETILKSAIKPR